MFNMYAKLQVTTYELNNCACYFTIYISPLIRRYNGLGKVEWRLLRPKSWITGCGPCVGLEIANLGLPTGGPHDTLGRVSSKQTKINFGSNRNKPKQDLFRV
jgi:hypothetical protein